MATQETRRRRTNTIAGRGLRAGMVLLVVASVCLFASATSPTSAHSLLADAPPPLLRFEGYLNALGNGRWTVGDITVIVPKDTVIIDKRGPIEIGAWIILWVSQRPDGSLVAQIIYVDRPASQQGPTTELTGILNKKLPKWWIIEDVLVKIPEPPFIIGEPEVGNLVWVMGRYHGDVLEAITAEVVASGPGDVPVEFEGTVREMRDDSWLIDDQRVILSPDLEPIGEPAVGKHVEVRARLRADGDPVAIQIRVVEADQEATVGAYVAAILPGEDHSEIWDAVMFPTEGGARPTSATFHVDGNTLVDESRGVKGPGQWAEVRGLSLGDNEYKADLIRIEEPVPVTITGKLDAKALSSADIGWLHVDDHPVWMPAGLAMNADAQRAGEITIHGLLLGNGVIWVEQAEARHN